MVRDPIEALESMAFLATLDGGKRWRRFPPGTFLDRAPPDVREALSRLTSDMASKHRPDRVL